MCAANLLCTQSRQLRLIKYRVNKILENKVCTDGFDVKSVMSMIDDMVLVYYGKVDELRIPDPVNGKALVKSIHVD